RKGRGGCGRAFRVYLAAQHAAHGERSASWVGGSIGSEQAIGVDGGINLRRRQRRVAEQFLDGAQIAAAAQQVGREAVAERVRGRRGRQAERAAQLRDPQLDEARRQLAPLGAAEHLLARRQREGAELEIILDRGANRSDERHEARLVALAGYAEGGTVEIGAAER